MGARRVIEVCSEWTIMRMGVVSRVYFFYIFFYELKEEDENGLVVNEAKFAFRRCIVDSVSVCE